VCIASAFAKATADKSAQVTADKPVEMTVCIFAALTAAEMTVRLGGLCVLGGL